MTKTILLLKYGIESVYEPFIGDNEVSFQYGFNEERVRMGESCGTRERQKTYVANCEFITESESGLVAERSWTFLTGPTGVFAVVEKVGNAETLHYILKDHQGSWTVITDAEGTVEQELGYDAWGNLRDPETWCVDADIKPMFDRGYTGHEHLTAFGLVNMNGRMYDPVMSSFLSVDRYVQQPDNSQGFNRYAYCMYNPLRYVDPTGWVMSQPNRMGTNPPNGRNGGPVRNNNDLSPFSSEITGEYHSSIWLREVWIYGEAIGASGDDTWSQTECRRIAWDYSCGGLSAEYSAGEAALPEGYGIGGGGGGLGAFWLWGYNAPSRDYSMASDFLSYSISTVGTLLGASCYSYLRPQNHKSLDNLGKNLSRAQKAKLASKYPALLPKGASAAKYGAAVVRRMQRSGTIMGAVGVGMEFLEVGLSGEVYASNVYNAVVGIACLITGLVGWIIGSTALVGDIVSYAYTGRTIGGNIDRIFDDRGHRIWKSLY